MVIVEIGGGILVAAAAVAMTLMLWVGVMGALGATRFERCARCRHLELSSSMTEGHECPHCRHLRLLHHMGVIHGGHTVH